MKLNAFSGYFTMCPGLWSRLCAARFLTCQKIGDYTELILHLRLLACRTGRSALEIVQERAVRAPRIIMPEEKQKKSRHSPPVYFVLPLPYTNNMR